MKKTIKEEKERRIIREELIGDNSLVQYEYDEETNRVMLVVRFVKNNTIKEHILITMTLDEYNDELDRIVKFNKNNSAIALFKKEDFEGAFYKYTLHDCYDLREHSFALVDFLDLEYHKKFPKNKEETYIVAKKKKLWREL